MKLPRGFGKNYFTLSAITATVNQVSITAQASRVQNFHMLNFANDEIDGFEEEEELNTLCPLQLAKKPCHCNNYFSKYTKKTLKLYYNQKLFFNYFYTLNNSISPPLVIFIQHKN
jgi:hypothetical protein